MKRVIEIIVAPNGQTRVETKGFVGSECREASQFMERALGRSTHEELKTEFYQVASTPSQVRHDAGS